MSQHVIEGTWEEIKQHEAAFIGHHLRVTICPRPTVHIPATPAMTGPCRVSAMGKYAGMLNSEDFMSEKQEEIDLEDRARR